MKTVAIDQFGGPEVFAEKDLPVPKPSRPEVRVKIVTAGFNPVDAKIRSGVYGGDLSPVLGIDFSGIIDAVGDPKGEFQVGDEVFGMAFGPSSNGSYAEYTCVPAEFIAKKPKNLSFEQAAAVPIAYLTYRPRILHLEFNCEALKFRWR